MPYFITGVVTALLLVVLFFKKIFGSTSEKSLEEKEQASYRESLQQAFASLQEGLKQLEEKKKQIEADLKNASPEEVERYYEEALKGPNDSGKKDPSSNN